MMEFVRVSSADTFFQVAFSYLKKKIIEKLLLEYTLFRVYIKVIPFKYGYSFAIYSNDKNKWILELHVLLF